VSHARAGERNGDGERERDRQPRVAALEAHEVGGESLFELWGFGEPDAGLDLADLRHAVNRKSHLGRPELFELYRPKLRIRRADRTLEPSLAKRTTVLSFSITRASPVRSGLAAAVGAAEAGFGVWAARTGRKQASAARTIDRAGIANLF